MSEVGDQQLRGGIADEDVLDENELFMAMTSQEKAAWEKRMKSRIESLKKNQVEFQKWRDNLSRRRLFVMSRIRKLYASQMDRFRFVLKMAETVNAVKNASQSNGNGDSDSNNNNSNNVSSNNINDNNNNDNNDNNTTTSTNAGVPTITIISDSEHMKPGTGIDESIDPSSDPKSPKTNEGEIQNSGKQDDTNSPAEDNVAVNTQCSDGSDIDTHQRELSVTDSIMPTIAEEDAVIQ